MHKNKTALSLANNELIDSYLKSNSLSVGSSFVRDFKHLLAANCDLTNAATHTILSLAQQVDLLNARVNDLRAADNATPRIELKTLYVVVSDLKGAHPLIDVQFNYKESEKAANDYMMNKRHTYVDWGYTGGSSFERHLTSEDKTHNIYIKKIDLLK